MGKASGPPQLEQNRDKPDDNQVDTNEIVQNLGEKQNNNPEYKAGNTKYESCSKRHCPYLLYTMLSLFCQKRDFPTMAPESPVAHATRPIASAAAPSSGESSPSNALRISTPQASAT